jgi:hypothetical protein
LSTIIDHENKENQVMNYQLCIFPVIMKDFKHKDSLRLLLIPCQKGEILGLKENIVSTRVNGDFSLV